MFSLCLPGFPPDALATSLGPKTCSYSQMAALKSHWVRMCVCVWLLGYVCQPCDDLAACSGFTPTVAQCQLGLPPASSDPEKDEQLQIKDGCSFNPICC